MGDAIDETKRFVLDHWILVLIGMVLFGMTFYALDSINRRVEAISMRLAADEAITASQGVRIERLEDGKTTPMAAETREAFRRRDDRLDRLERLLEPKEELP